MVHYEWVRSDDMTWLFLVTYILNMIDLFFTIYWVDMYGINAEANPFGKFLFDNGLAEIAKVAVVGALLLFLYVQANVEDNDTARIGLYICASVYAIVCIVHCLLWLYIKTI